MNRSVRILGMMALLACPLVAHADTKTEKREDLSAKLEANEHRAWDAFVKKDADAFRTAMEAGAMSIDPSGVMSVAQVVQSMADYHVTGYTIDHAQLVPIDGDVVAFLYTAHVTGTYRGQPIPEVPIYSSTVYKRKGNTWIGMVHQESYGAPEAAATPAPTGH